jgi:hypothetical protein
MSKAVPVLDSSSEDGNALAGSDRVIQMALELDAFGTTVRKAVADMLDEGLVPRLLELLDGAPAESSVAEMIRAHLMTPLQLKRMLSGDDVDDESLRILVERLGKAAVEPLFQYLMESESRAVRRKIFDVLGTMGKTISDATMERLKDERWFVKRNMLALIQRLDTIPEGFTPVPYFQHKDPRVRREGFPIAFRMPTHRTRALASALADGDERIVRMALLEIQDEVPETVVPVVVSRVLGDKAVPALRSLAVRALGNVASPLALETLLEISTAGKSILGRPRLAPKTPELLPALTGLAKRWRAEPRAAAVLDLAEKSKDVQIQDAARSGGSR